MTKLKRPATGKVAPPGATVKRSVKRAQGRRRYVLAPLPLEPRAILFLIALILALIAGAILLPHDGFRRIHFSASEKCEPNGFGDMDCSSP